MKVLVDDSLSARAAAGHNAIYVSKMNLLGAPDTDVMVTRVSCLPPTEPEYATFPI